MVTAEEARQLRVSKGAVNHQTYKEIYEKISNRIKLAAARGETFLEYRVPPLVPGRPMYDISHAVRYNADKLRHAGFAVEAARDVLRIDWAPVPDPPQQKDAPKAKAKQPSAKAKAKTTKPLGTGFGTATSISQKLENLKNKLQW